jgi:hypothetical protein
LANRPDSSPLGSALRRSVAGDGFGIGGSREKRPAEHNAVTLSM